MLLLGAGTSIEAGVPGAYAMTRRIVESFDPSTISPELEWMKRIESQGNGKGHLGDTLSHTAYRDSKSTFLKSIIPFIMCLHLFLAASSCRGESLGNCRRNWSTSRNCSVPSNFWLNTTNSKLHHSWGRGTRWFISWTIDTLNAMPVDTTRLQKSNGSGRHCEFLSLAMGKEKSS